MKKTILLLILVFIISLTCIMVVSCSSKSNISSNVNVDDSNNGGSNNNGDTHSNNGNIHGQVPIYQGMTISNSSNATTSSEDDSWDNGKYKVDDPVDGFDGGHWIIEDLVNVWVDKHGNKYWRLSDGRLHHRHHPGCQHGDYDGRNDEIDVEQVIEDDLEEIEEKVESTLEVVGALKDIYYATLNQDIYITVHISNPSAYEILSFVLNGSKYTSYMFERGSDLEHLILKVNAGNVPGIKDYTIDEIKYIDGTEIKDVVMNGDKTVKTGVYTDNMVSATISNEEVTLTTLSYNVSFSDNYNLVEKSGGFIKTYLYDGENIIEKEINKGNNLISFDGLTPNTLYPYAVVAYYDDLTGNDALGADVHILDSGFMYTNTIVLFKDIVATQTSISWDYEWEETYENKTITELVLYQGDEKVRDLNSTAKTAEGLLSNNQYKIVATYKNVKNEDETIMILVTTLDKAIPNIEITNMVASQTGFTYGINIIDTDNVGELTKIELLHGNDNPINVEDLTSREFVGLLSNNEYSVRVTYSYDLNDGVGTQTIIKSTNITTVAKAIPSLALVNPMPSKTGFTYETQIIDNDHVGEITKIELLHGDDDPVDVEDLTSRELVGLLSNNQYFVRVTYSYDLNDGVGIQTLISSLDVTTIAKTIPSLAVVNPMSSKTGFTYETQIIDYDQVGTITKIELLHGEDEPINVEDLTSREFIGLLSNNLYSVKITYAYDLNDGVGTQTLIKTLDVTTVAKLAPSINIINLTSTISTIGCEIEWEDVDSVGEIVNTSIKRDDEVIDSSNEINILFDNLLSGTKYVICACYQYDLNDGTGIQVKYYSRDYATFVETISIDSISLLNNDVVRSGEELNLRIFFINPSEVELTSIYVNNQKVNVIGGDRIESAIIKFIPNQVGLVNFSVNRVTYLVEDIDLLKNIESGVSIEYPIYADLDVSFLAVTSSWYENSGKGTYITIENPYNYDVYNINGSSDFIDFGNNQYYVTSNYISSIEYAYSNYGHTTQMFSWNSNPTMSTSSYSIVSTPEDFLNMTTGYYYLTNDLDFRNTKIENTIQFSGVLIGNGYTIRGIQNVLDTSKESYFDIISSGSIYDVVFTELYISVTNASSTIYIHPLGYTRLINCSINGDILVNGNISLSQLNCYNDSCSYNINYTIDGNNENRKYTATNTIQKNERVVIQDNILWFILPNGKKYLFGAFAYDMDTYIIDDDTFALGDYAFYNIDNITEISYKENLKYIGNYISKIANLVTICDIDTIIGMPLSTRQIVRSLKIVGDGITSIPEGLLYGFGNLEYLDIPFVGSNIDSVESSASTLFGYIFGGNSYSGGKEITQTYKAPDISGGLFNAIRFEETYYIPANLNAIKIRGGKLLYGTFSGCDMIFDICISNVSDIGDYAFTGCSLTEISLSNSIRTIGDYAFNGCSFTEISLSDSLQSIGDYAFYNCASLLTITIPNSITTIGESAFAGCSSLTKIIFENGLMPKVIGLNAFNCSALNEVHVGSVEQWCNFTFIAGEIKGALENSEVYSNPLAYAHNLYIGDTLLVSLVIPQTIETISDIAFYGCQSITTIEISKNVTSIGRGAFDRCSNVVSVNFASDCVTSSIGEYAFFMCSSLTKIVIPTAVESLELEVLGRCSNLVEVVIPISVENIDEFALEWTTQLTTIYYCGTIEQWNNVTKIYSTGFGGLRENRVYYYSETEPLESGQYWHYVDGVETIWPPVEQNNE